LFRASRISALAGWQALLAWYRCCIAQSRCESENQVTSPADSDPRSLLGHALTRARWALFWERLWPALAAVATAVGLFLAVSWLGLWLWLPPLARAIGLFGFAVLTAAATAPLLFVRFPSQAEGLRRLDHVSGIAHRPATSLADEIATPRDDPWSIALWRAHVERMLKSAHALRPGLPTPRLAARDPMALRALVLILVIATFISAGGDRARRVAAAFDWQGVVAPKNFRLDAWVSPPTYTQKPPVILPGVRPGEVQQAMQGAITVPAGSVLVVRASGNVNLDVAVNGGLAPTNLNAAPQLPPGAEERRFLIKESGGANVRGVVGHDIAWTFNAVPDRAPMIELTKDPEPQARGGLQLTYKVDDDYGVVDAQAKFALKPSATAAKDAPRPLYGPPDAALLLAQQRMRSGVSQTIKDFNDHPWAGADVMMTLIARDEAGNEGRSQPTELRLPQRMFVKPLAKALIEQRRVLALNADARDRVAIALDALTIAPERFIPETAVYLGVRAIYWNLAQAKTDDDLREVVARLWSMATQIEDGNVSDAELALRQAQEALREALERGANDEEIKRLTEQLRAALDKFLQALAEEIRKHPEMARRADPNGHYLRSQDLKNMIDRLEQMARSGSKDAARQLLDQLQQMLENLQMARPGQGMDGDMDDDMMSMLDDLGKMLREQQQLRDRTFKQGQDQRRQRGQRGQQGDQGDQMGELRQNQQALRDQMKKLLDEMKRRGLNPGQQGDQGSDLDELGRAGDAMGEAEGALGESNTDGAVDAQGRAIESMRRGAQALAQALQQQGFAFGPGPGGQPGRAQQRANPDTDPLGRPLRGPDYGDQSVKVPGEIDVQRARRILEELRRRFADPMRPQIELDYIERLLKDY
jgi:uncharacterized protein (TIGR02302 family)